MKNLKTTALLLFILFTGPCAQIFPVKQIWIHRPWLMLAFWFVSLVTYVLLEVLDHEQKNHRR